LATLPILALCDQHGFAQAPSSTPRNLSANEARTVEKKLREKSYVLVAAGDIASCLQPEGAQATAS
jgi:hypothetical protein